MRASFKSFRNVTSSYFLQSLEALLEFRNASYAYSVLGKDPTRRAEYDAKLKADDATNTFKSYIIPFTQQVAIPFVNFTIRKIGSITLPIMRTVLWQIVGGGNITEETTNSTTQTPPHQAKH